ncbi:MAG: hypothetical protein OXT65_05645 [Alphaproteobacteria bacterium]|nr:hypothetical protein [Alphaproteobacteria bacterium]
MKKTPLTYLFALTALILSGCASLVPGTTALTCPVTGFMHGAEEIVFFGTASKNPGKDDIAAYATLDGLKGHCRRKSKNNVVADFDFYTYAKKGGAGDTLRQQNLSYFIAVLAPDESILQRQVFYVTIPLDKENENLVPAQHSVTIPLPPDADASAYKITIGFTMTPEQRAFARKVLK